MSQAINLKDAGSKLRTWSNPSARNVRRATV